MILKIHTYIHTYVQVLMCTIVHKLQYMLEFESNIELRKMIKVNILENFRLFISFLWKLDSHINMDIFYYYISTVQSIKFKKEIYINKFVY